MRAESCFACPAGYKCPNNAHVEPVACDEGTYSAAGATDCINVPQGYFINEKATSLETMEGQKCPAGSFCVDGANGLSTYPDRVTNPCSIGHYCPEGTTVEIECPAGTYQPALGRESLDDCIETPGGYWTPSGTSEYRVTGYECEAGYYCLPGSTSGQDVPCPIGTFRDIK